MPWLVEGHVKIDQNALNGTKKVRRSVRMAKGIRLAKNQAPAAFATPLRQAA